MRGLGEQLKVEVEDRRGKGAQTYSKATIVKSPNLVGNFALAPITAAGRVADALPVVLSSVLQPSSVHARALAPALPATSESCTCGTPVGSRIDAALNPPAEGPSKSDSEGSFAADKDERIISSFSTDCKPRFPCTLLLLLLLPLPETSCAAIT